MIQKNQRILGKHLPDVFESVGKLLNNKDKIEVLRSYNTKALRWYVNSLYNVDWSTMKVPKYTPSKLPVGACRQSIGTAIKRIEQAYYYREQKPDVTERNLLLVLEEMSAGEAQLLVNMFNGRRKIEGISKAVLKELYPNFFRVAETTDTDEE